MLYQPIINENHIAYYNGTKQEFIGQIVVEPDVRLGYVNYVVSVIDAPPPNPLPVMGGGKQTTLLSDDIKGKVQLRAKLYPRYNFGDYLNVSCKLQSPTNFDDKFLYDKYLVRSGIYSVCYYPSVMRNGEIGMGNGSVNDTPLPHSRGDRVKNIFSLSSPLEGGRGVSATFQLRQKIFLVKKIIADRIDQLWPEPKSSFMAGLLYGSRSGLPADLTNNFNRTGITHIIAISGYNISIIVVFVMIGLIYIGLYRQQAFWVTLIMIFLFVIFTGASASVVRAGIMGSIVLLAQYWGRTSRVGNILLLTVVIMLIINPMVLLYDAGFQLSFLATLGLIYLAPLVSNVIASAMKWSVAIPLINRITYLNEIATSPSAPRNDIVASTLSAIIATLPLILYQFGRLSIVALIVNILILWLIPWLMLFGFLAVILSFIFFPVSQVVAYLAGFGLDYVIMIVNWFGNQKWSSVEISLPSWLMVLIYIFMLFIFVYEKNKKQIV